MEQLLSPAGLEAVDSSPDSSPVGTPDEERCLTQPRSTRAPRCTKANVGVLYNSKKKSKSKWIDTVWKYMPLSMMIISIVQILTYTLCTGRCLALLRYSPSTLRSGQLQRLLTYALLHADAAHVALNVALQLALGGALAAEQGARHVPLYLAGGVAGALAARQALVGASACVYALLGGHLAHLYLNFSSLKYRLYRLFSISFLVVCDVCLCVYHTLTGGGTGNSRVSVSVGAHGAGGAAGALLGLLLLKGPAPVWLRVAAGIGLIVTLTIGALTTIYGPNK